MKQPKLIIVFLFACTVAHAQNWQEWMQQKKTQKKYLLQQIAALKVYIDYAKKGVDIAAEGLATIRDIKNGDFNLHSIFLRSFKNVNPAISRYSKVAAIIAMQVRIVTQTKAALKKANQSRQFTNTELEYSKKVIENLLAACVGTIEELLVILSNNQLEMRDNERIQQIDICFLDMQEKSGFSSSFTSGLQLLAAQRSSEQAEINYSKRINGLQ